MVRYRLEIINFRIFSIIFFFIVVYEDLICENYSVLII